MDVSAWQWALSTGTIVLSLVAGYVGASLKRVSRSSAMSKRLNEVELTTADLESSFQSLLESHKRLRSKQGMKDLREQRAPGDGETKAEARRRLFGVASGPEFAKRQLEHNGNRPVRSTR